MEEKQEKRIMRLMTTEIRTAIEMAIQELGGKTYLGIAISMTDSTINKVLHSKSVSVTTLRKLEPAIRKFLPKGYFLLPEDVIHFASQSKAVNIPRQRINGAKLLSIRRSKNISQSQLATETGVQQTKISKTEREGHSNWKMENVYAVAKALGCETADLIN